ERSRCRADANTDQYQIRRQTLTVFQFHRFNLVCALNLRGFAVGVKHHAVGHMAGKNGFADRCAELFGEGHLVTGQNRDVRPYSRSADADSIAIKLSPIITARWPGWAAARIFCAWSFERSKNTCGRAAP